MHFFVDTEEQKITATRTMGEAAHRALEKLGLELPSDADPVREAINHLGDRGLLLNLSAAFESIANSDSTIAQEKAKQFQDAVNRYNINY